MVERAVPFDFDGGGPVRTCSAEHLVVLKALAARPRDRSDIEEIAKRQGADFEWQATVRRLRPLAELKESSHLLDSLERIRTQAR